MTIFCGEPDEPVFDEPSYAQAEDEQAHWEQDPEYLALYFPVEQGYYDDDPNPYHGDYAEDDGF